MRRLVGIGLMVGLMVLAGWAWGNWQTRPVQATSTIITVDTNIDSTANDGLCSLREAVGNANDNGNTFVDCPAGQSAPIIDNIQFGSGLTGATITLLSGSLQLTDDISLDGNGAPGLVISGGNSDRVFRVNPSTNASLANLTIADGLTSNVGGGIENQGDLILNAVIVRDNESDFDNGGGLSNSGTLIVTNSEIHNNSALDNGGGIYNTGQLTLTNSIVYDNTTSCAFCSPFGIGENGGAGLKNRGTAHVSHSTFHSNFAGSFSSGGAIWNDGTIEIRHTTLNNNTADADAGGGFFNGGTAEVTNSTLSGNMADYAGGGLGNESILTLNNVTITENNTAGHGGGLVNFLAGTMTIQNTIVANNISVNGGEDCDGDVVSGGYNLIERTAGCFLSGDLTGNVTGQPAGLGSLQDNGGATETHAVLMGSLAVDGGNPAGCNDSNGTLTTDQRDQPRPNPVSTRCDIGAYESDLVGIANLSIDKQASVSQALPGMTMDYVLTFQNVGSAIASSVRITDVIPLELINVSYTSSGIPITPTGSIDYVWEVGDLLPFAGGVITVSGEVSGSVGTFVNNTALIDSPSPDGNPSDNQASADFTICTAAVTVMNTADDGAGSLRDAFRILCPQGVISFDGSLSGNTIALTDGQIDVTKSFSMLGVGAPGLVISGNNTNRILRLGNGVSATISDLTFANGQATEGGAIKNYGRLTLDNVILRDNMATDTGFFSGYGGAIWSNSGLFIRNSQLFDNVGSVGGAVGLQKGRAEIENTLIMNNIANENGGGIGTSLGLFTVRSSTISGNHAIDHGGGIYGNNATMTVIKSDLTGNSADRDGGGIYNYGVNPSALTVYQSNIVGNSAANGAGIHDFGFVSTILVRNSGIYSNTTTGWGGGINFWNGSSFVVENSTISGNEAGRGGGVRGAVELYNVTVSNNEATSEAGGIDGVALFQNSVVAGNTFGGDPLHPRADCSSSTSAGFNVLGMNTVCAPAGTDIPVDSTQVFITLLDQLANYGGLTLTHALLPGGVAIDGGDPAGCLNHLSNPLLDDQRRFPRPQGTACDIGAYESP